MSIRIGNTVYLEGMAPIEVEPRVARELERIALHFAVDKDTLADLITNNPGGVVRVKALAR